ncbi:MAG: ABC transporter substrate-binding protein, partial [Chloroflexi bacterium]|nr:ABC transporter substrate-binding protein [Chloroflexota bacterium]
TVVKGKARSSTGNFLTNTCPGNQGAGPFKFVCSGTGFYPAGRTPSYTLVPNPYYYGKKPKIEVVLPATDTLDTTYKEYQAGQIDTTIIPTAFVAQWKGNKQYLQYATSDVTYLTPNTHMAPMNDVHCRLAVAYGLNRNLIETRILHNASRVIYTVVPPSFLGYYNGADNPHFNLAKAKSELAQCSSKSTPLKITYPTGTADTDNTFAEIANELRAVGFDASTHPITANDWYNVVSQSLDKSQTQIVRNGWQQDYPDPQDYVTLLLRCGEDYDIGGWCNNQFDSLVDKGDLEGNNKVRAQDYIKAQHIALTQGAWITLTNAVIHALIKPYVHGLTGTVAYGDLVPVGYDWSRVSVSNH